MDLSKIKRIVTLRKLVMVILVLITVSVTVFLYFLLEEAPRPEEMAKKIEYLDGDTAFFKIHIVRYPAYGNITPLDMSNRTLRIGVSPDRDKLNFGVLPRNTSTIKFLEIGNRENVPLKICIKTYGDVGDFIDINEDNFVLKGGEGRKIMLRFGGDRIGSYIGEIDVISKKPKYKILEFLLPLAGC